MRSDRTAQVSKHPLVRSLLSQLRDVQTSPKEFRNLLLKIGQLLCYEATADLSLQSTEKVRHARLVGREGLRLESTPMKHLANARQLSPSCVPVSA